MCAARIDELIRKQGWNEIGTRRHAGRGRAMPAGCEISLVRRKSLPKISGEIMHNFTNDRLRRLLAAASIALAVSVPLASDAQDAASQSRRPEPAGSDAYYLPQGWDRESTER